MKPQNYSKPIRVLHVEDESVDLELTRLLLKRKGYNFEFDSVTSAEKGLKRLKKEHFDVVVSDYLMPKMNGLEFLEKLRKNGNDTPFIIFTGKGEEEVAMDALNKGANRYVRKDGDPAVQCDVLAQYVYEVVEERVKEKNVEKDVNFLSEVLERDKKIEDLETRNSRLREV